MGQGSILGPQAPSRILLLPRPQHNLTASSAHSSARAAASPFMTDLDIALPVQGVYLLLLLFSSAAEHLS